jgi:exopolysaccharide biosynthesis polyprenyl glycosylphosphotransferase
VFHLKTKQLLRRLFVLDLLISALVFLILLDIYPTASKTYDMDVGGHLGLLFVILVVFSSQRAWSNSHENIKLTPSGWRLLLLVREQATTGTVCGALIFLLKLEFVSRFVVVGYFLTTTLLLVCLHYFLYWWYLDRKNDQTDEHLHVLVVGSGRRARMLADQLQRGKEWGVSIVGFLDPKGQSAGRRVNDEILGHVSEISEVLRNNVVEEVVVAVPRGMIGDIQAIIDACQEEGVNLSFMADVYDFPAERIELGTINQIPLIKFLPVALSEGALLGKRIFDLLVVLAASPVLAVIFLIVGIAIRVDSKGPIFFSQERVGLNKRIFNIYKFRSMVPDAEAKMASLEHLNEVKGPAFKIKDDPRITRLGRFLRASSLDELPQLINVLKGDMSLVGPRPMTKRDVELFDKGLQRKRFSARPGITCIWQISGRSNLSFEEWLQLDLHYIANWSLWLDIKILFKTIPSVLKGSGAV